MRILSIFFCLVEFCQTQLLHSQPISTCNTVINYPRQTLADIDQDGDLDCFIGSAYEGIYYFENKGTKEKPNFLLTENKYAGISNLTSEAYFWASAPHFNDINSDGTLDMFVGWGYGGGNGGTIIYYKNIGTKQIPKWAFVTNSFANVDAYDHSVPYTYDWEQDGDLDLIVGGGFGDLFFVKNIGTKFEPKWDSASTGFFTVNNQPLDVGWKATPVVRDINKDKKPDLIIGNDAGQLIYYQNISLVNAKTASFKLITSHFGGVDFPSLVAPSLGDLNGDKIIDILAFNVDGQNKFYYGLDSTATPNYSVQSPIIFDLKLETPVISTITSELCVGETTKIMMTNKEVGSIQWKLDGSNMLGANQSIIEIVNQGKYTLTISRDGCEKISNEILIQWKPTPPVPTIVANGPTIFCEGSHVMLAANTVKVQWYKDGIKLMDSIRTNIHIESRGTYTAKALLDGCESVSFSNSIVTKSIPLPDKPTITTNGQTSFCNGSSLTLSANTPKVQWYKDGIKLIDSTSSKINIQLSGIYTAKALLDGCESLIFSNTIITESIPLPDKPAITASGQTSFCEGSNVRLVANAAKVQWYKDGIKLIDSMNANILIGSSGTYSAKVILNQCESSFSNLIATKVNSTPTKPIITIVGNELKSSSSINNFWYKDSIPIPEATEQTYRPTSSGFYSVIVIADGCPSERSDKVNFILTSSKDTDPDLLFAIYPNPVLNILTVENKLQSKWTIKLIDYTGKHINIVYLNVPVLEIDMTHLTTGCYYLVATSILSRKSLYKKVIKI